ncbi:MAG: hypothetical protein Kow00109_09750 [Acidobacteriota bacterium]
MIRCEEIEVLLSGYLDGELTQQQSQRVELHLAECERCRQVLEELQEARRAAASLVLPEPAEREWKQMEATILERRTRRLGWLILLVWAVVTLAYGLFHVAVSPTEPLLAKILVFAFFLGMGLLFFSVLSERIRTRKTDRYRGVEK